MEMKIIDADYIFIDDDRSIINNQSKYYERENMIEQLTIHILPK